jgi:hypothetical protein
VHAKCWAARGSHRNPDVLAHLENVEVVIGKLSGGNQNMETKPAA